MSEDKNVSGEEIKVASAIKNQWEDLQKKQSRAGYVPDSERINVISVKKNENGDLRVQVKSRNGEDLTADGEKKAFNMLSEKVALHASSVRVASYVKRIREEGFHAVEGEIPASLRDAVIDACRRANVSLTSKGERAEREEMAQKQFAAKVKAAAAESAKRQEEARRNKQLAGVAAGALFGEPILLHSPAGSGLFGIDFSIPRTKAVAELERKGVVFKMPPVSDVFKEPSDLLPDVKSFMEKQTLVAAEVANSMSGNIKSVGPTRALSNSVTIVKEDGTVYKGQPQDLSMSEFIIEDFLKTCKEKGKRLADLPLADKNQKKGFPANLYKKAKALGLDPNAPDTLEIVIKELGSSQVGAIKKDYFEKHLSGFSEDLSKRFEQVHAGKEQLLKDHKKSKKLRDEMKAEGKPVPSELADLSEIKEKIARKFEKEPYDLREDARKKGMTLALLCQKEADTRKVNPLAAQNKTFKSMLELGALAYDIDRTKRIPPKLIAWAEKHSAKAGELLSLRGRCKSDPEELRKVLPPLEAQPASLEKRRMPEKLAGAARPEYLAPVNTNKNRLTARLRENAEKLTPAGKKKTLPRERTAQKRPPAVKQTPQRTPADIMRIKMLREKMAAQH